MKKQHGNRSTTLDYEVPRPGVIEGLRRDRRRLLVGTAACLASILLSAAHHFSIKDQHVQYSGYGNYPWVVFSAHIPMFSFGLDVADDIKKSLSYGDISGAWVGSIIASLSMTMWTVGTFGLLFVARRVWLKILLFYVAALLINFLNAFLVAMVTV